ncbi:LacI family DNA-binding transcriptional regulator [Amaricoccus macauensis]|uniref:LacI family DNA-binding transcriptional regulator n=1 Tax=Amaricoccus macauensis TaxID=57001 RepID=UPI003C7EBF8F
MPDKQQRPNTITADRVAEVAGVSRWTVNRAFRQDASISEKSRQKVMEAAEQLGYAPDLLASSLRADRSNLVALLVDDFSNPHKLVMIECLTRILRKGGWDTLLVNTLDEADAPAALLNASQRRVDAAVLIGLQFNEQVLGTALGAQRMRKLIVFARYSENPNTVSICCDDEAAMSLIANYVRERGYQRPFFLAGPETYSAHLMRKETFLRKWQREKGVVPPSISVPRYDPKLAYDRVSECLGGMKQDELPDILVCENDALAIGAVDAIRFQLGRHMPGDIAVTGFDDVPQAESPNYRLTTYRQPLTAMAEGLVQILKASRPASGQRQYTGELVRRESA